MPWVVIPGYGVWPSSSYLPRRSRIIGQATQDFLSGQPSFTVADERPPIRWPNMSPEGLVAHRKLAQGFGADPNKRHGFDALLELVEEDQRAFENPTPKQARDQAEKMAETVRELSRKGISHEVDWLTFTSPEVRNGKPTVVIGVNPSVVVGKSPSGVPLVNVRGEALPVAPSKIGGRPVEFRVTTVVAQTKGATEIAPFDGLSDTDRGANDMGETIRLDTDVGGARLSTLLIDKMPAHCGTYLRHRDNSWSFFLDPLLRVRLLLRGVKTPVSVPADKLVCWNTIPTEPLVGGFMHPMTGFHCRSASIPTAWDTKTHGTPAIYLTGANGGIPNMADAAPSPTPLRRAEHLAVKINEKIGAVAGNPAPWWLYTLPMVCKDGKPVVKVGVKGDYQPDAKELEALPWAEWVALGVEIDMEFVPPEGSGVNGTVAKISPEGVTEVGMADDMGSAPIDSVWPTSSPDWREPTGDATGDSDQAMGAYDGAVCPMCGEQASGATRCIPGEYFCPNGHHWSRSAKPVSKKKAESMPAVTLSDLAQSSHGFPARWRSPSKSGIHPRPAPFADDTGMGAAPIVAMPTGMLNWDRVSGYEGQPWVTKDWSGQGFMGSETTVFDDTFMGDMSDGSGPAPAANRPRMHALGFGALTAALGAAAGWAIAPGGDSRRGAIAGGIGGGIAGLLVGKIFGGAQGMMEQIAARPTGGPVRA